MDSKILEYMIAIADEKSISKAADLFLLTQPVMSRHLQRIEKELGAKLFFREKRELHLTDAGRLYINQARLILHTEKKMIQDLNDLKQKTRSNTRIMIDPYLVSYFERHLMPAIQVEQLKRQPDVSVGGRDQAVEALKAGLTGYAVFRARPFEDRDLHIECIYQDELLLCIPDSWNTPDTRELVLREGPAAFPERYLIMERSDLVMRRIEQDILRAYHCHPRNAFEVTGTATVLMMVQEEQGFAFLPSAIVKAAGSSIRSFSLKQPFPMNTYLAYLNEHVPDRNDRQFLSIIRDRYARWEEYLQYRFGANV